MSGDSTNQNVMIGTAVMAGILGILSGLIRSNKKVKNWKEQARGMVRGHDQKEIINKNLIVGGIAGGIIGATAALLLAPKSGSELIKDITHTLTHPGELISSATTKKPSRKPAQKKGASAKTLKRSKKATSGKEEAKEVAEKTSSTE